jgi:hypothetical protein
VKLPAPLVPTAISSQREAPVKAFPKSSVTVKSPLLTATALVASKGPIWAPPLAAS